MHCASMKHLYSPLFITVTFGQTFSSLVCLYTNVFQVFWKLIILEVSTFRPLPFLFMKVHLYKASPLMSRAFLKVWPIHYHFLLLVYCPIGKLEWVLSLKSIFDIKVYHKFLKTFLKYLLTNICKISCCDFCSTPKFCCHIPIPLRHTLSLCYCQTFIFWLRFLSAQIYIRYLAFNMAFNHVNSTYISFVFYIFIWRPSLTTSSSIYPLILSHYYPYFRYLSNYRFVILHISHISRITHMLSACPKSGNFLLNR